MLVLAAHLIFKKIIHYFLKNSRNAYSTNLREVRGVLEVYVHPTMNKDRGRIYPIPAQTTQTK